MDSSDKYMLGGCNLLLENLHVQLCVLEPVAVLLCMKLFLLQNQGIIIQRNYQQQESYTELFFRSTLVF
jgi:hypothetical protein